MAFVFWFFGKTKLLLVFNLIFFKFFYELLLKFFFKKYDLFYLEKSHISKQKTSYLLNKEER